MGWFQIKKYPPNFKTEVLAYLEFNNFIIEFYTDRIDLIFRAGPHRKAQELQIKDKIGSINLKNLKNNYSGYWNTQKFTVQYKIIEKDTGIVIRLEYQYKNIPGIEMEDELLISQ